MKRVAPQPRWQTASRWTRSTEGHLASTPGSDLTYLKVSRDRALPERCALKQLTMLRTNDDHAGPRYALPRIANNNNSRLWSSKPLAYCTLEDNFLMTLSAVISSEATSSTLRLSFIAKRRNAANASSPDMFRSLMMSSFAFSTVRNN